MNVAPKAIPDHLRWEESAGPEAKNNLGKDDFMKLLLTQLQNQDPLKPTDHEQFAAQLAQFGSLEKLSNIESGIQGMRDGVHQENKLQALGMIGKNVKAWGNSLVLKDSKPVSFSHALGEGVRPLRAVILNDQGVIVRNLDLNGRTDAEVEWDGKDDKGTRQKAGSYNFRVTGVAEDGSMKESGSEVVGKVIGVDVQSKVPTLVVENAKGTQSVEVYKVSSVSLEAPEANTSKPHIDGESLSVQDRLMRKTATQKLSPEQDGSLEVSEVSEEVDAKETDSGMDSETSEADFISANKTRGFKLFNNNF